MKPRVLDGGEQLEVLAEAEVGQLGAVGERHALELDHRLARPSVGEVAGVAREAVREVEERVRVAASARPSASRSGGRT